MKSNYFGRLTIVLIVTMMILLAGEYLHATDEETASDSLGDYTIVITKPASFPAYFPLPTSEEEAIQFEAQVIPDPEGKGSIRWECVGPGDCNGLYGSYKIRPGTPGEYYITAIFELMGKEVRSATVKIGVVKVEIEKPRGSLTEESHHWESVIITPAPIRYDFQGVVDGTTGLYTFDIEGTVLSIPQFKYKWTLEPQAGDLIDPSASIPGHFEPKTPGNGVLKLTALDSTVLDPEGNYMDTQIGDTRHLIIYQDHLARDIENFDGQDDRFINMGGKILSKVDPKIVFFCHSSVAHAYNGTNQYVDKKGIYFYQKWKRKLYEGPVPCWKFLEDRVLKPDSYPIERGDVIAYFGAGETSPKHSATFEDDTWTWGANNIPLVPEMYGYMIPEVYCYAWTSEKYVNVFKKPKPGEAE